ncbi:hypothetical protein B0H13DRAFT_1912049 [Mycena leptocephala]|nr:hypothetical protein B0H13DRAFT_1912049 [Mycena leptocephala]
MEALTCACGKSYSSDSHFERHQNTCAYLLDASHRSWDLADSRAKKKMKMTPRFAPSSGAGISRTNKGRKAMERKGRHDVATANINNASSSNNRYESLPVDDPMAHTAVPPLKPDYDMPDDNLSQGDSGTLHHRTPSPTTSRPPTPAPREPEAPLPARRIRRPTSKAIQALEDTLPEGPGPLEADGVNEAGRQPEPLMLRIPRVFHYTGTNQRSSPTWMGVGMIM